MPMLGTLVVLSYDPKLFVLFDMQNPWLIVLAVVFLCTCILPLILSWILLKTAVISSISQPTENDRRFLLSFTTLCFILAYYCFHSIPGTGESLKIFLLGINISLIATLITSLFTKVSFHSVGAGGLLGTVIGLIDYTHVNLFPFLIAAFAVVILTGLSRYKLKAHGAFEIYVGLIIGIAIQALLFFYAAHVAYS